MKLSLPIAVALLASLAWAQNDDCAQGTPIAGTGVFPFSTLGATDSGQLSSCNDQVVGLSADAWFAWTPPISGAYRFNLCSVDYDAVIGLRDSCGGIELGCEDEMGCTPDFEDLEAVFRDLTAGTTYPIQLDGWGGVTGTGDLEITYITPPLNDDCANAIPLGTGASSIAFDSLAATGAFLSSCNPGSIASDVWFRWTSGASTGYEFSVVGATFDATLALYTACDGTELGCDNEPGNSAYMWVDGLIPNTTYWIQVDGFTPFTTGGPFGPGFSNYVSMGTLEVAPPIPNDTCANPITLVGPGPHPVSCVDALDEGNAASCLSNFASSSGGDAWYSWTAPVNGDYQFDVCGATFDIVLSVHDACGGIELGCGNQSGCASGGDNARIVLLGLPAGTTYLIQVEGDDSDVEGTGDLLITRLSAAPIGTSACMAFPNSSGQAADILAFGSLSIATADLELVATGLPPNANGLFYYGTTFNTQPFGDGIRCIGGPTQRLPIISADPTGSMTQSDVFSLNMSTKPLVPGTTLFQAWYRDAAAGQSGFNLSDSVLIAFVP